MRGLARTARVITSAALIMIFVFGAFVLNSSPEVKMFGLGLAFAVLVDATIVRMMLVPSIMEILGDANWWFPKWLGFLPRLDIDGDGRRRAAAPVRIRAGARAAPASELASRSVEQLEHLLARAGDHRALAPEHDRSLHELGVLEQQRDDLRPWSA